MSQSNGHHPIPQDDLSEAADAVQTLLNGELLDDHWDMERFGAYADLVNRLLLAAVVDLSYVSQVWTDERHTVPALSARVGGEFLPSLVRPRDLQTAVHAWYRSGGVPKGVSPGWQNLERIYRIARNEVTLITGMPSAGKSTFLTAMLVNLMSTFAWPITIFSPEQAPPERLAVTLIEQLSGWPFSQGPTERMGLVVVDQMLELLDKYFTFVWPSDESPTVDALLEIAQGEVERRGIKGFAIDPWNDLHHPSPAEMREDLYIGQALTKLRQFARSRNVHIWVVAHPKQLVKDSVTHEYPIPGPYDISGGSKWRDKADNILALWRSLKGERSRFLQIHTQKIRFRENGQIGRKATLLYHPETSRYSDVEDPDDD